jgi:hypothetical protein
MPVAHEAYVLPEAWQVALWHREVEGDDESTVGALLGVTPLMAGSLVETARSALRQGLVTRHREHTLPTSCVAHALRLERNAGRPVPRSVQRHAESCTRCAVLLADLEVVGKDLAGVLAAHLLGPAADGYLQVRRTGSFARDRA